jgi:hypothetical protein
MTHATATATRRDSRLRIVVTGLIAQHPTLGGVAWDYAQYAIGLARLGHEVYYIEDSGQWPYNLDGGESGEDWVAQDPAKNLEHLRRVLAPHGLEDRWAYRFPRNGAWYGLPDARRREILAGRLLPYIPDDDPKRQIQLKPVTDLPDVERNRYQRALDRLVASASE